MNRSTPPLRQEGMVTSTRVAAVLATVLLPVLAGVAVVYALIPLDPPDLGWGHAAGHAIPAAVIVAIVASGRRVWPAPRTRGSLLARRLLVGALLALAAGQAGEALVAATGHHESLAHAVPLVLSVLAGPAVLLGIAATVVTALAPVVSTVVRARPRRAPDGAGPT